MAKIETTATHERAIAIPKTTSGPSASVAAPTSVSTPSAKIEQVTISGRALMLSRLFNSTDTDAEDIQTELTNSTYMISQYAFLTREDRDSLSRLYALSQDQGINLGYVDDLAHDLGKYRKSSKLLGNFNSGNSFDITGRLQTVSFTERDQETASRILAKPSIGKTQLDSNFLRHELDPGYSFSHWANFEFLEWSVAALIDDEAQATPPTDGFSTYTPISGNNFIIHTASEITFPPVESDFIVDDGKLIITKQGVLNGFTIENGMPVQKARPDAKFNDIVLSLGKQGMALLSVPSNKPEWLIAWLDQWIAFNKGRE